MKVSPHTITFGARKKKVEPSEPVMSPLGGIPIDAIRLDRLATFQITPNGSSLVELRLSPEAIGLHSGTQLNAAPTVPVVTVMPNSFSPKTLPFVDVVVTHNFGTPDATTSSRRFPVVDGVIANTPLVDSPNARPML
jgi:hypothetical protein